VSAITLTGFKSISRGNQRTSCQTNLIQIYQACRLYAADETGNFPYYNAAAAAAGDKNIGLWTLYTFPQPTAPDSIAPQVTPTPVGGASPGPLPPLGRYVRNPKILHCPADNLDPTHESLYDPADTSGSTVFNPTYLSYQTTDGGVPAGTSAPLERSTYQSLRTTDNSAANLADWKRQLLHFKTPATATAPTTTTATFEVRPPAEDTVVLWCPWHFANDINKPYDNILFSDGAVRFLPRQQIVTVGGTPQTLVGWHRLPLAQ